MSMANPFIPADLDNPELALDMRVMANRLDAQADRFEAAVERSDLAGMVRVKLEFRDLARSLRINADKVQPDTHPLVVNQRHAVEIVGDTALVDLGLTPPAPAVCPNCDGSRRIQMLDLDGIGFVDMACTSCTGSSHTTAAAVGRGPLHRDNVEATLAYRHAIAQGFTEDLARAAAARRVGREPPPPSLAQATTAINEMADAARRAHLDFEDAAVRATPLGKRCAISEPPPVSVEPGYHLTSRRQVVYLAPDEQPPLGECWTVYPINDGQRLWQGWYDVSSWHGAPPTVGIGVGDTARFQRENMPPPAAVFCDGCEGTGQTYGSGGGPPCPDCGGSGRRGSKPESLDDELRRKLAADAIQSTLKVKRCSPHHIQLRGEDDVVVLDWWPTTGKARATGDNGSATTSTHRSVDTLLEWLRSL